MRSEQRARGFAALNPSGSHCRRRAAMLRLGAMNSDALVTPRSDRAFFVFNGLLSTVAVAFIGFILLRGHSAGGSELRFMPAVNACLNALSAACLVAGYVAIRQRKIAVHRLCM